MATARNDPLLDQLIVDAYGRGHVSLPRGPDPPSRIDYSNIWLWEAVVMCLLLQAAAVYVPFLQRVLHTVAPTAWNWGVIAACSLLPFAVVELVKLIQRLTAARGSDAIFRVAT